MTILFHIGLRKRKFVEQHLWREILKEIQQLPIPPQSDIFAPAKEGIKIHLSDTLFSINYNFASNYFIATHFPE